MALLDDVKKVLKITNVENNTEVQDLINTAKLDLKIKGVYDSLIIDSDPLIKQAIILYCKASFGFNNPEAERFMKAYESLRLSLLLSGDYNGANNVV